MEELEPLALDRDLERAARAWRSWRRQLAAGSGLDDDPFARFRGRLGRTTFQIVSELPEHDPLREPLRRWLYRLTEQRINHAALLDVTRHYRVDTHVVEAPEYGRFTLADLLANALSEPARATDWLSGYLRHAGKLAALERTLWQRRQELAERLGLPGPDPIERCATGSAELGREFLSRTADAAAEFSRESLSEVVELSLGREAFRGWPGRLGVRPLGEWLNEARLLEDVDLEPGELPRAVASSSFLRGLLRLGAALVDALAPRRQPFVVRHDPYGLRRRSIGALFALLTLNPDFMRRRLGLGRSEIADQRRVLGRVVLLATRAAALRVCFRAPALAGEASFQRAFEELFESTFGALLPGELSGAMVRLHLDDDQRFCGVLLASELGRDFTERHDLDWYRNPRACEELRALLDLSPEPRVEPEPLARAASVCERLLHDCLR